VVRATYPDVTDTKAVEVGRIAHMEKIDRCRDIACKKVDSLHTVCSLEAPPIRTPHLPRPTTTVTYCERDRVDLDVCTAP